MSAPYARDKPLPPISRPKRLQRSKSTSTTPRNSSGSHSSSSKSGRGSQSSGSSHGSNSGRTMMQTIIQVLNTPIVEPEYRRRSRSSLSDASGIFARFRRSDDSQPAIEEPRVLRRLKSSSSFQSATTSMLSDYDSFRKSMLATEDVDGEKVKVVKYAKKYRKSMEEYIKQINALPDAVRYTLRVQRMLEQLEFTSSLLEPSTRGEQNLQVVVLLDGMLKVVRELLVDVHRMLRELKDTPPPLTEDDDHEDECEKATEEGEACKEEASPREDEYEYDIPEAHLAMLITGPDDEPPRAQRGGLRKMKSSGAVLGGPSRCNGSARDSGYATGQSSRAETPRDEASERLFINRKVRFSELLNTTYTSPPNLSQNVEDVAESLTALNAFPLFARAASSESPEFRLANTVDITYGKDGTPVAMSSSAIIENLILELGYQPTKEKCPIDNFSDIIFTTFRFFWEPEEFLGHLEKAYDGTYFNDRKLSAVLLVRLWVLSYWLPQDSQRGGLIDEVRRFLYKALTDGFVWDSILADLFSRLEQYEADPERSAVIKHVPEIEYEPMPFRFIDFSRDMPLYRRNFQGIRIMSFNNSIGCMELARQLTLKESGLYLRLSAREVISRFVVKDENNREATLAREKMGRLKEFSGAVFRWAAWNILKRSTPVKRARAFGFMMRLAKYLLAIRNFSSAHSVFNGALSTHLDVLFQTDTEVLPKARANMEYTTKSFDENRDISMQSSAQPTVPIMATYVGKLARLLEAKGVMTPSKVDESVKLVNISFFRAATRITYAMESNQRPYDFKAHAPLQEFIDYTFKETPSEDEIHGRYLTVKREEQSGTPYPKPGLIQRLRANTMMPLSRF